MTDSATNASKGELTAPEPTNVIERLEQYSLDHPDATMYLITSEDEARQILGAMAVSLGMMANDVKDQDDRDELLKYARIYHRTVTEGSALAYIRALNEADELSIFGMRLAVPAIVLQ